MTPFASVAILEKLALLKIALCSAPALSSASSRRTLVTTSTVPAASSGMAGSWYCSDMYQPPSGYKTYRGFSSTACLRRWLPFGRLPQAPRPANFDLALADACAASTPPFPPADPFPSRRSSPRSDPPRSRRFGGPDGEKNGRERYR